MPRNSLPFALFEESTNYDVPRDSCANLPQPGADMILPQAEVIRNATAKRRIHSYGILLSHFRGAREIAESARYRQLFVTIFGRCSDDLYGWAVVVLANAIAFRYNRAGGQVEYRSTLGRLSMITPQTTGSFANWAAMVPSKKRASCPFAIPDHENNLVPYDRLSKYDCRRSPSALSRRRGPPRRAQTECDRCASSGFGGIRYWPFIAILSRSSANDTPGCISLIFTSLSIRDKRHPQLFRRCNSPSEQAIIYGRAVMRSPLALR
jgi:hypothetical protein